MTAVTDDARVLSVMPDHQNLPLDADITIDGIEYARIVSGIAKEDGNGESVITVSAFNSSI